MTNSARYRLLLQNICNAHAEHKRIWQETKNKTKNNTEAYAAAAGIRKELYNHLEVLHVESLEPLHKPFYEGRAHAIDEIISFLEIDLPAFRVGYVKESYFRKLKKLPLNEEQVGRLQALAVARCASTESRREDSEIRRLMIKLADQDFLEQLAEIPAEKGTRVAHHKARMLEVVLEHRKDLKNPSIKGVKR